jgi:hypothetical protein
VAPPHPDAAAVARVTRMRRLLRPLLLLRVVRLLLWALRSCCRTLRRQVAALLQLAWVARGDSCC